MPHMTRKVSCDWVKNIFHVSLINILYINLKKKYNIIDKLFYNKNWVIWLLDISNL